MGTNRRQFLKQAAVLSAAPFILPSRVWGAEVNPNDRINMGFIGMGKQSRGLLGRFLQDKRCTVLAVCDVDTTRREDAQKRVNEYYTVRSSKGSADCAASRRIPVMARTAAASAGMSSSMVSATK